VAIASATGLCDIGFARHSSVLLLIAKQNLVLDWGVRVKKASLIVAAKI
jgi:hypothetical protein